MELRDQRRAMAVSAAGIYAGATFLGFIENAIPGGQTFSYLPGCIALALTLVLALYGARLPRQALALLGPIGVVLIGVALAEVSGPGDGAVLYLWPALWMACFFGNRGAAFIVVWIGIVHALVLSSLPGGVANVDRWLDVIVAVLVVVAVTRVLVARNDRLLQRLVDEARVDPLTGLLNRRGFDERMQVELARAVRERSSLAVVTFDLDRFKRLNDEHGHEAGDRVLAWIGGVLSAQVRGIDVVARLGGEEFAIVLPQTDAAAAHALAERIRCAIASTDPLSGRADFGVAQELEITVSGGVAAAVAPLQIDPLLLAADLAMYEAKREGRDRILVGAVAGAGAPVAA